jgi:hypothetical protein
MADMFELDGSGNIVPTGEADPLDIFHELVDGNIVPRANPTSPPAATPDVMYTDQGDGTGFNLSIDGYSELTHTAWYRLVTEDTYALINSWTGDVTDYDVVVAVGQYFVKVESALDGGGVSTVIILAKASGSDSEGVLTQLANEVANQLELTVFSQDVRILQKYPPLKDIYKQRTMTLVVTPRSVESEIDTREDSERIYQVDVTVVQAVARTKVVDVDQISKISEEVVTLLERKQLIAEPKVDWKRVEEFPFEASEGIRWRVVEKTLTLSYVRYA